MIWVEGEPGIGKSSLVAEGLATADDLGWDIGWGTAGQLRERLPLRVMLDCLQVRPNSPDPRRVQASELLRSRRQGLFADGDASDTGIEVLVTLVDELCTAAREAGICSSATETSAALPTSSARSRTRPSTSSRR